MIWLCTNIVFWLTFVAEMRCCFKQISVGMILRTQNSMFICANFLFCFKRNNFGRFSLSRQGAIGLLMLLHYKVCSKGWFQIPSTTRTESNSWSGSLERRPKYEQNKESLATLPSALHRLIVSLIMVCQDICRALVLSVVALHHPMTVNEGICFAKSWRKERGPLRSEWKSCHSPSESLDSTASCLQAGCQHCHQLLQLLWQSPLPRKGTNAKLEIEQIEHWHAAFCSFKDLDLRMSCMRRTIPESGTCIAGTNRVTRKGELQRGFQECQVQWEVARQSGWWFWLETKPFHPEIELILLYATGHPIMYVVCTFSLFFLSVYAFHMFLNMHCVLFQHYNYEFCSTLKCACSRFIHVCTQW